MTLDEALTILGMDWPRHNKLTCSEGHSRDLGGTPSLHLYRMTDSFYCFSCGINGDAFGLIAAYQGKPINEILAKYGNPDHEMKSDMPVTTKLDMMKAARADWMDYLGQWWKKYHAAIDDLPHDKVVDKSTTVMDYPDEMWGGPLDLNYLYESSPAELQREVDRAKMYLGRELRNEQTLKEMRRDGIQRPAIQHEVSQPGGSGGGSVRGGTADRSEREVRMGPTTSDDAQHEPGDQAQARLLRRRRLSR